MILLDITITEDMPLDIAKRKLGDFQRESFREVGEFWHAILAPLHFTRQAHDRYGYQQRKPGYLRRKRREAAKGKVRYGGMVDNVYSGAMEDMLKGMAVIRAFPSRMKVTMTGPRYMTADIFRGNRTKGFKYGRPGQQRTISPTANTRPDIPREVTAVTEDERVLMTNKLAGGIANRLRSMREKRRTKI